LTVRLWDAKSGAQIEIFHGHDRPINTIAASPDGRWLYTGGSEGTVRGWDLEALDPGRTTWSLPQTAYSVAFNRDESRAVVATYEGWLRIMDARTGRELRAWQGHARAAVAADWSADDRWIASTGSDGRVVLWDAGTGNKTAELQDASRQLESVAFSPDGSLLAAPDDSGRVRVWRVPSGELRVTLSDGPSNVEALAWSPDGLLATTSTDGKVRLWDVETARLRGVIDAAASGLPLIAFHPGGRLLAVGIGRSLRFWDLARGTWARELSPRSAPIARIAFSPDGDRLVAALSGNLFELWDAETGDVLLRLPQAGSAWSAQWTRHDELVLIPLDKTIRVLRAVTPEIGPESSLSFPSLFLNDSSSRRSSPGPASRGPRLGPVLHVRRGLHSPLHVAGPGSPRHPGEVPFC
jgi:WD40 repeat protein